MSDIKVIIQEENFNAIIKEEKIVVKLNGNITSPVFSVNQKRGNVILNKNDIGLGNVNNTSDIDKPVSDATEIAIDLLKTVIGTRAFIFNQTPANGTVAYATDREEEFLYFNGWQQTNILFKPRSGATDMGVYQDSNLMGYGIDYTTDKALSNVLIRSNNREDEGGVRTLNAKSLGKRIAQFYLDGSWKTVLTGINIEKDDIENPIDVEITDFEPYRLSLITGNSDLKDTRGKPLVQNMKIDMGVYQSPLQINGGTF
jgi:hypothetical protein